MLVTKVPMLQVVLRLPVDLRVAGGDAADNDPVVGGVADDAAGGDVVGGDWYGSARVSHSCPGFLTLVQALALGSLDWIQKQSL